MARVLCGNLNAEAAMLRALGGSYAEPSPDIQAISSAAALGMLLLAEPGDRLWTPTRVSRSRLGPLLDRLDVELISGAIPKDAELIPWAWTDELPHPKLSPELVARANDKRLALRCREGTPFALANSHLVSSLEMLESILQAWPHPQPWIVKAPLSASGRLRLKRTGPIETESRARLRRLFVRFDELILEPWVERSADYGICGTVAADGEVELASAHGLSVVGNGVFHAAELDTSAPSETRAMALAAAEAIAALGYHGPFSVDAFVTDGQLVLSEINARLSFGLLAHRARRVLPQLTRLVVTRNSPAPQRAQALVNPAGPDGTGIYLETRPA